MPVPVITEKSKDMTIAEGSLVSGLRGRVVVLPDIAYRT